MSDMKSARGGGHVSILHHAVTVQGKLNTLLWVLCGLPLCSSCQGLLFHWWRTFDQNIWTSHLKFIVCYVRTQCRPWQPISLSEEGGRHSLICFGPVFAYYKYDIILAALHVCTTGPPPPACSLWRITWPKRTTLVIDLTRKKMKGA